MDLFDPQNYPAVILSALAAVLAITLFKLIPSSPNPNAPKRISGSFPFIGTYKFFTARWDLFRDSRLLTSSGNFTFYIGPHHIIGLSGDKGQETFFESRDLSFNEGYATLLGTSPGKINQKLKSPDLFENKNHFSRRLSWMLRGDKFGRRLPKMINDVQTELNKLGNKAPGIMDPFESLGHIVALLTMRAIGSDDIADDSALLKKSIHCYDVIQNAATPLTIMYPWLPTPAIFARTKAGYDLYMILDKITRERKKTGKKGEDPLQHLTDEGDGMTQVISFIIGALFAGLANSAITIPWILLYLSKNAHWLNLARAEIDTVLSKHNLSLTQLSSLPLHAWESEFPVLDLCLKECIRLQLTGTGYRRNVSGHDVRIGNGGEVIPKGALVAYHFNEAHRDENVYPEPERWDPGRYLPDRQEDKKKERAYIGWGAGLHPCLGMKFAKMESNLILAFFLTMFDFEVVDKEGNSMDELPSVDLNNTATSKPKTDVHLKYTRRARQ